MSIMMTFDGDDSQPAAAPEVATEATPEAAPATEATPEAAPAEDAPAAEPEAPAAA